MDCILDTTGCLVTLRNWVDLYGFKAANSPSSLGFLTKVRYACLEFLFIEESVKMMQKERRDLVQHGSLEFALAAPFWSDSKKIKPHLCDFPLVTVDMCITGRLSLHTLTQASYFQSDHLYHVRPCVCLHL